MNAPKPFDFQEALCLLVERQSAPGAFGDFACYRFEYSCRGDRVPGRLVLPPKRADPAPVVLAVHDLGSSKDAPVLDATARWVEGGVAVAAIDLPLHGERASSKLSRQLLDGEGRESIALWEEFVSQALLDLRGAVDALCELPWLDAPRLAFAGLGLGGALGCLFCGSDPRPRAAALAMAGGRIGLSAIDPRSTVHEIGPRPVLFISSARDGEIPRRDAEALHRAAREPVQVEWIDAEDEAKPRAALTAMGSFLTEHL